MLALSGLWWGAQLYARTLGWVVPWTMAPGTAHALLMGFGFMPLFFVGFLFTAGPKWLNVRELPATSLLTPIRFTLVGWAICLVGFHGNVYLSALGMLVISASWANMLWMFFGLWRQSRNPDRVHASLVLLAGSAGLLCMAVTTLGLALDNEAAVRTGTQSAIWFFLAPIFAVVSHRMIPFFSASAVPRLDAWRPMWLVGVMVGVLWFEGAMTGLALAGVQFGPVIRYFQIGVESIFALLMLWLAVRWGLVQSLHIRLLAMLHGGFLWLGIAMALLAFSHTLMALSHGEVSLGLAPLHALTTGYLGATLFAMATRVSSGHSGRPLAADNIAWALYWVLQAAALARVVSALLPVASAAILLLSIAMWMIATTGWALRYGGWFLRPRVDGRPG
jgi:uncharacterized protein involved in response to NO